MCKPHDQSSINQNRDFEYSSPLPINYHSLDMSLKVLEQISREKWRDSFNQKRSSRAQGKLLAMYSSYVGGVTTDIDNMVIPIDDHMVHRGHGVYDSGSIQSGRLVDVFPHVDRFLTSARDARIEAKWNREELKFIIEETNRISRCKNGSFRIFASAGPGNFGIHSDHCEEVCLYVVIYTTSDIFLPPGTPLKEVTVSTREIPMKPSALAHIKSVDYLSNVLLANRAINSGGFFGIWVSEDDYIKEGSIASLSMVTKEGEFVSPPYDDILRGCTVEKLGRIAESNGLVKKVEIRPVTRSELYMASEVIMSGGDIHVYPVVEIDGHQIGQGSIGPVCSAAIGSLSRLEATSGI